MEKKKERQILTRQHLVVTEFPPTPRPLGLCLSPLTHHVAALPGSLRGHLLGRHLQTATKARP